MKNLSRIRRIELASCASKIEKLTKEIEGEL